MDTEIERIYLSHKIEKCYPDRYDNAVFEEFNKMNSDTQFQNDYKKWKAGINYKTNRKIKIGGKTYKELEKSRFSIKLTLNHRFWGFISFDELKNIDAVKYLEETEKIKHEIDIENAGIKDYNKKIDIVVEKIKNLESWDDFVEFEGKKYGLIYKTKNNIHIENNCLGKMIFIEERTEYDIAASLYKNDRETTYKITKCNKCNYEHKEYVCSTGGGSRYVSQCMAGFIK